MKRLMVLVLAISISLIGCGKSSDISTEETLALEEKTETDAGANVSDNSDIDSEKIKNLVDDKLGQGTCNEVQDKKHEIRLVIYTDKGSTLTEKQIQDGMTEALKTSWSSMQILHDYLSSIGRLDDMNHISLMTIYNDDSSQVLFSGFSQDSISVADWSSDDFTQIATCAETFRWEVPPANLENYEYKDFKSKLIKEVQASSESAEAPEKTGSEAVEECSSEPQAQSQDSDMSFDTEWYKTYNIYEQSGTGHSLEFVWYDDGTVDVVINSITEDTFDSKSYSTNSEGGISYSCTAFEVNYYPNDRNSVQITKGDYSGYYYLR